MIDKLMNQCLYGREFSINPRVGGSGQLCINCGKCRVRLCLSGRRSTLLVATQRIAAAWVWTPVATHTTKPTNMFSPEPVCRHTGMEIDACTFQSKYPVQPRDIIRVVGFFYTISVVWSERAWQLAAGGEASVYRLWVRSPLGPR